MGVFAGPEITESGLVLALDAGNPRNFNLTAVEVLVVGGGGAGGGYGGNDGSGGGGAGGLIYNSNFAVTPGTQLAVQAGAGGAAVGGATRGTNGNNSVFSSLTAIGGGGGGTEGVDRVGKDGGSGGGAGGYGIKPGGLGTAGQGFAGGDCTGPGDGGGGGAGAAGQSGLTGIGGIGLVYSISGTSTYYAGGGGASGDKRNTRGGGGALGGLGGGGKGQDATNSTPPENGTHATGGGGGAAAGSTPTHGAGTTLSSGAGGNGIVIVRYPGPQKAIGGTVTSVNGDTIHTFTTSGNFTPLVNTNGSAVLGLSDLSGNRNFGTTAGSPTYNSANGGSLSFNGSNTYVQSNVNTNALDGDPTFSVDMFVRRRTGTNIGAGQAPWGIGGTGQGNGVGGWTPTTNLINLDFYDSTRLASTEYYPEGQFVHIAWTKNGAGAETSNVKCYVNGIERALTKTRDATRTNQFNTSTNGVGVVLGRLNGNSGDFHAPVDVASFKVYTRALSAAEVSQNFNALRGRFGI